VNAQKFPVCRCWTVMQRLSLDGESERERTRTRARARGKWKENKRGETEAFPCLIIVFQLPGFDDSLKDGLID
jgi:hypothetical protein